jgi:hypothetical protein
MAKGHEMKWHGYPELHEQICPCCKEVYMPVRSRRNGFPSNTCGKKACVTKFSQVRLAQSECGLGRKAPDEQMWGEDYGE